MVHPLNDLKDLKKARTEISKAKKAVTGAPITRAYFDSTISNLRAEFAEQIAEALAPVRAALEIDDLDAAIDELDGLEDPEGRALVQAIHDRKADELDLEGTDS